MTEAQYAAALAASAAQTRRAWQAHNARMCSGIASVRVKWPVIAAVMQDISDNPASVAQDISARTGYALRSTQDAIKVLINEGRIRSEARGVKRVFILKEAAQ